MKDRTVNAKVPGDADKGTKDIEASIVIQEPSSVEEAIKVYGGEAVLTNAMSNWVVTLQSNIRSALKRGESVKEIQARLKDAKMGVALKGGSIDPKKAYLALLAQASPEERKKMIAELTQAAAGE